MTENLTPGICFTSESNARFAALPPDQQRVEIALDGIRLLEAGKIRAERGHYFEVNKKELYTAVRDNPTGSFQDLLGKFDMSRCEVCAKGLLFVTIIARRNRVTNEEAKPYLECADSSWLGSDMSARLGGVFSAQQFRHIEVEFEGRDVEWDGADALERIQAVMKLTGLTATNRLIAILRNIVSNHGEFKPVAPSVDTLLLYANNKLPRWHRPARKTVTVVVTQKHLDEGDAGSNLRHPLTLALHAAGLRRWMLWGVDFRVGNGKDYRRVPEAAKVAMDAIDAFEKVVPFTFEVAIAAT